ncbi:ABC transporter permease [Candidatus Agathobaculum pullicola]|uniref:ABC transporter permease n=1 Tax=Candidatus Agathobaculum pullicola TaxID=2838426 RepID=UPI003F8F4B2E
MKVANRRCIFRLSLRTLRANRARNRVAVAAIALTALLFTALLTIAMSLNEGVQQSNFRQVGGFSQGGFKYLTQAQFEALRDDPRIAAWGLRRFLGMPTEAPFNKSHVEIGYSDTNQAHWMYCDPVEGRLPKEGTDEAATDTRVLALLGIEPELGAQFTVTFTVDGHQTTQTFTLCGWWEYDEAVVASHILLPESRVQAVLDEVGVTPPGEDGMTGAWNMDMMLRSGAKHIEQDLNAILDDHGMQSEDNGQENYVRIGVNWGYTSAQLSEALRDPATVAALAAILLLIVLTGYLIIYNVFQISVTSDIRFYGLLKTIGTTPRQLRRIIRQQAVALSLVGIPIGLAAGWLVGCVLTPVIVRRMNGMEEVRSADPRIFVFAAVFALATVLLSCRRPGRLAGKVSPVEAVRYTEGAKNRRHIRRGGKRVSLWSMAWANLGRSRGKTAVTILSLSLAVVLLTVTMTFTRGFDLEKYLRGMAAADFQLANADYFQVGALWSSAAQALPEQAVTDVQAAGGVQQGGCVYGLTTAVQEFVTEDWYRTGRARWYDAAAIDQQVDYAERTADGLLADRVQLYGMEAFALDRLTVLEGDLDRVYAPGSRYIAAVYTVDEYGRVEENSHWARVGDTVTLRYVERFAYYDAETGAAIAAEELDAAYAAGRSILSRAETFRDETYTVAARVAVPTGLNYRYYGADEFVMNSETFCQDTGTDTVMYYAFDVQDGADAAMESFLADYTTSVAPELDYASRATYSAEFYSFRNMFLTLGGVLCLIIGLVGVLNFFNAILTGIIARRHELAVLQAIGMTPRQLRRMLVCEGLLYMLSTLALTMLLTVALAPLAGAAVERMFWFFTYRFTVLPVLLVLPLFAVLGVAIPVLSSRAAQRHSVVERLREE